MSLSISASQVATLIANPSSISGYSSSGPIIITGAITYSQANSLNAVDATYIQATISETTVTNLSGIAVNNSTRASLNKFTTVVSDTAATAAELNAVQALTSVAVDASNVAAIEASSSSDITTLYTGTVPTGIGSATISVNDTTAAASTLNTIDGYSTGLVTSTATTITGTAADLHTMVDAAGIAHAADVAMTVTGSTVTAADLLAVNLLTTGLITVSGPTMMTGNITDINAIYVFNDANPATQVTGLDAINLTVDAVGTTNPSIANIVTAIGLTTGTVTATTRPAENAIADFSGITGTGHAITLGAALDDASMSAAALKALDESITTTITFDAGGVTGAIPAITSSSYSDIIAILDSTGISGLGTAAVTVSGTISVAEANILNGKTTGVITATISDNAASTLVGLAANTGSTANAYTITVGDTEPTAANLNTIDGVTSVAVDINSASTISGTLSETHTLYANKANFSNIGNEAVTVTSTTADAASVTELIADTSGLVTFSNTVTAFSGDAAQVHTLLDLSRATNSDVAGIDLSAVMTLSGDATDGDIQADDLVAIEALATSVVQIDSSVVSLNGSFSDVHDLLTKNKTRASASDTTGVATPTISGLDGKAIVIDDGNEGAATITLTNYLDLQNNYSTGVITATFDTTVDSIAEAFTKTSGSTATAPSTTDNQIASGNAFSLTIKDTTVNSEDLIALQGMTSGLITLNANGDGTAPIITGPISELKTIYTLESATAPGITGIADAALTIDAGSLLAADLVSLDASTTGDVDARAATQVTGLAADVIAVLDAADDKAGGDNHTINFNNGAAVAAVGVTITDATLAATEAIDLLGDNSNDDGPLTSGTITIVSSSIEGTYTNCFSVSGALQTSVGASAVGLSAINYIVTDNATDVQLAALMADTTGVITSTITGRTLSQLTSNLVEPISSSFTGHNLTITVADTSVTASGLNTLSTLTKGTITLDTDSGTAGNQAPTITGTITDINTAFADTKISGKSTAAVTVVSGATAAQIVALDALTSGTITATVTDGDMTTLNSLTSTNALSVTVSDASIVATELTALDTKISGQLNISSANTITGTLAEVTAVLDATTISGRGTAKASISGSITVAEAAAVAAKTSGAITATITETDLDALVGAGVSTVKADSTGGAVTIGAATGSRTAGTYTIGTADYTSSSGTSSGSTYSVAIASDGTATVTVTSPGNTYATNDIITIADAKLGGGGAAALTFMVNAVTSSLETGNDWTVTVANQTPENSSATGTQLDEVISAANLNTLNGLTNQVVTVTAPTIDGTHADLTTAFNANTPSSGSATISGLETKAVTVTDASITQAEAETAQAWSTGVVTATIGKNDFLTAGTVTNGTVNLVTAITDVTNGGIAANEVGTYVVKHSGAAATLFAADGTTAIAGSAYAAESGAATAGGSGATFTIKIAANGINALDDGDGNAGNDGVTDAGRVAGTYYIDESNSTTSSSGAGHRMKVVINSDGAATVTLLAGGSGFADNETITVASSVYGGGTAAHIMHTNGLNAKSMEVELTDAGSGYTVGDTFTVSAAYLDTAGSAGTNDLVFKVGAVGTTRTAGTTNVAANQYTTSGGGSGATFAVVVDGDGDATITGSGGTGFEVGDTITIADSVLGAGGAPALTFAVGTVGKDSIADFIAQTTAGTYDIEAGNAFAITFEDASVAAADLITANSLTTGLITLDNGGSAGTLTGNTTDLVAVYAASELTTPTITGIADYALTVSNVYTTDADCFKTFFNFILGLVEIFLSFVSIFINTKFFKFCF